MKTCYNCDSEIKEDFNFCPYCGANQKELRCPKCSYKNEPNSKFCQECGAKLIEGEKNYSKKNKKEPEIKLVTNSIPETGITIEFNNSTSQTFELALEEAKKFESFVEIGEGKKSIYRINIPEDQIEQLDDLIENMKGWRNRRVYQNGKKVSWDSIFGYKWCFNKRKVSYKPEFYCFGYENNYDFNLWGCIQTRLDFNENSELFTYGEWLNDKGDWRFDKERIRHEIEKKIFQFRYCPALNFGLIKDVIDAFPEEVNPSKDKNWKFIQNWVSDDGLKVIINNYGYKEEIYMNGVAPKNMKKFVKEVNKKIQRKLPLSFN